MPSSVARDALRLTGESLVSGIRHWVLTRGQRLPPSPPISNQWLGHLHDIRREGFVRFHARCVAAHGRLVLLRFGPPLLGWRFLLVADPEVALQTLTQDLQRGFPPGTGPRLAFGEDAVFCTAAHDPIHASRQHLILRHVTREMLRLHAAAMAPIWRGAIDSLVAMPAGHRTVEHSDINPDILYTTQQVALRCWMGIDPSPAEIAATLRRYLDTGNLLIEVLFNSWYFLDARRRVAKLRDDYAPLLARSLEQVLGGGDTVPPEARFVAESLDELGWDRGRLAADETYRARLLADLHVYQHLFTVMLPSAGSTGGTILFLIRQLAADSGIQSQLRDELLAADLVSEPRPPPHTASAIRECLRLYPQAAGITRQLATSRHYGGWFVPKGAYTFTQLHTLHRDRCSYPDPETFDASRPAGQPGSWAGFSLGPMACTGRGFAELQIATALKALLSRYRISGDACDPAAHNDYQGPVTLQPAPFALRFSML